MARIGGCVAGLAAAAVLTAPAAAAPDQPRPVPGGARLLEVPVGAAPTITAAPPALGNDTTPTFAWTGAQPLFTWEISDAAGTVVETYTGPETTATAAIVLTDGSYTFRVWQHDLPDGPRSAAATSSFSIDATAPAAPRIIGRPPFPTTVTTPAFALDGFESGAAASWLVVAAGGSVAQGPQPVSGPTVTLGALPTGSYVFQVRQTDPAGNQSAPASEPFAIISATVVPTPTTARRRVILPKMNTARLRPRVGAEVPTVRPVLAWARGPRGTTLYNVQVFRVGASSAENATAVKLTKLRSMFPRARQVRLRGLRRGQCYVWRVWPYIGARFTARPLGVSNFCVAPRTRARGRG
jgi:hypothetical protein